MLRTASLAAAALVGLLAGPARVFGASSKFCEGGSWSTLGKTGGNDRFRGDVDAPSGDFKVQGKFVEFMIDPSNFAVYNYAWLGKENVGDMTDGQYTTIFASKVPDHRGANLTSKISLEIKEEVIKISRTGNGVSVTISAKDCAQGGIFQMEPERADNTSTRIVHTLADGAFQYDNPIFRSNLGKFLGSECVSEAGPAAEACIQVRPRVNIGATGRPKMVLRDSAQVASRLPQPECGPDFSNNLGIGGETTDYCGGMSIWDVASGGRMGMVTGEDSVEVGAPPDVCVSDCFPGDHPATGELAVLGFPDPVPEEVKLKPFMSEQGFDRPLTQF
ncbi:uncharacterized protein PgNI_11750 [Pyricularia grisea]|uniref:Uncharacterized protein n=1 Tax=Pyricularia grisea TaxID=148305 RepID=A0A6P8AND6_PYRGI|nr:uncharacterized protein PgNI_11750 [Pyricularia grisea]TLD03536.1 hypothetical protein PgNI_11750 [Pyricularia grisea]